MYLRCCHEGSTVVQDTLFEENGIAVTGYRGTMADLKRCTFRRNEMGVDSADKYIEDSLFEDNVQCAVCSIERTRLQGCTIRGHKGQYYTKAFSLTNIRLGLELWITLLIKLFCFQVQTPRLLPSVEDLHEWKTASLLIMILESEAMRVHSRGI